MYSLELTFRQSIFFHDELLVLTTLESVVDIHIDRHNLVVVNVDTVECNIKHPRLGRPEECAIVLGVGAMKRTLFVTCKVDLVTVLVPPCQGHSPVSSLPHTVTSACLIDLTEDHLAVYIVLVSLMQTLEGPRTDSAVVGTNEVVKLKRVSCLNRNTTLCGITIVPHQEQGVLHGTQVVFEHVLMSSIEFVRGAKGLDHLSVEGVIYNAHTSGVFTP